MHKRISNIIGLGNLPRAVVKVRVPRRPGAVEGERQLLVVLVLLTPHPEGGEHLSATGTSTVSNDAARTAKQSAAMQGRPSTARPRYDQDVPRHAGARQSARARHAAGHTRRVPSIHLID